MRAICVLALFAPLVASVASAQSFEINRNNRTISITASEEATAEADLAVVTVGFEIFGPDSNSTYAEAGKRSQAIISAIKELGIEDKSIESLDQQLTRNIQSDNKDTEAQRAAKQFRFSQSWSVKVAPDKAAEVIRVTVAAGANQGGQIDWQLADHKALQAHAASDALKKAHEVAAQMADGLHVKLGDLLFASNEAQMVRPVLRGMRLMQGMTSKAAAAPPLALRPQTVREEATVRAVFAIE